jgi:predicted DNA-binding transcriptional regulator YafY
MANPSERNRQVVRQWEILIHLGRGPATLAELATSVGDGGVTTRTIRRDFEALEAAGFPLYTDVHEDGATRWHLLSTGAIPSRRVA